MSSSTTRLYFLFLHFSTWRFTYSYTNANMFIQLYRISLMCRYIYFFVLYSKCILFIDKTLLVSQACIQKTRNDCYFMRIKSKIDKQINGEYTLVFPCLSNVQQLVSRHKDKLFLILRLIDVNNWTMLLWKEQKLKNILK